MMKMRKRFITLVGWLMAISLFSTGFATTITFYHPPAVATAGQSITPPTIQTHATINPSYFGILWNMSGNEIVGTKFAYNSVTTATGGTQYSFRSTKLSVRIEVNNATRTTRLPAHYNSDCLVVQATIDGDITSWAGVANFSAPVMATIGLTDGTVFEKVAVTNKISYLEMRIPIAMIYRLAAAQKGATSSNISTLAISMEFADNGVASADVAAICGANVTFKMYTDYIS